MRLMEFYHYSYYCLPSTLSAIFILFPLYKSVKSWDLGDRVKVLTFILIQSFVGMVCETLLIASKTPELSLFWDRMMYVAIILFPASLLHINLAYLQKRTRPIKHWYLIYGPSVLFIAILPTDLFIAGVEPTYWGWGKVVGPGYAWFQAYLGVFFLLYFVFILYQFFTEASPRMKNEILCLTIATFPTVIIGCAIVTILTIFNITQFNIMVHALCILWHCITISIAMLSRRSYDVFAHLPWFSFEKRQLQKDMAALIHSGDLPLDYEQIVEKLNSLLRVDIAIHTINHVYANFGCDPVFADFDTETLFERQEILIRHQIPPNRPEYEILSRHKCDLVASLFCGGQYVSAVRLGVGLTDSLYSNYDLTLINGLLSQLRLALVYVNIASTKPAQVVLHQLHGKVCSVQKTGDVCVYVVDYDDPSVSRAKVEGNCRVAHQSNQNQTEFNAEYFKNVLNAVRNCPACGSSYIYTAVNKTCILDHQKKQMIEAVQISDRDEHGTHGCFECHHQWISTPPPSPSRPPHVIDLIAYKTNMNRDGSN
jgi:hypothetical protein